MRGLGLGLRLGRGSGASISAAFSVTLTGLTGGVAVSGSSLGYTANNLPEGVTVTGQSWRTATSGELGTGTTYTPNATMNDLEGLFVRLTLSDASTVDSPASTIRYAVDPSVSLSVSSATVANGTVAESTLAVITLGNTSEAATLSGADAALFEIVGGNLRNVAALDADGTYSVTVNISNSRPASASAGFVLTVSSADTTAPFINSASYNTSTDTFNLDMTEASGAGTLVLATADVGDVLTYDPDTGWGGDANYETFSQAVTVGGGPYTVSTTSTTPDGSRLLVGYVYDADDNLSDQVTVTFTQASAFVPTSIASFEGEYDPSDVSTLYQGLDKATPVAADGDNVAVMETSLGAANDMTYEGLIGGMTYKTDGTYHWIEFNGTGCLRTQSQPITDYPFTIVALADGGDGLFAGIIEETSTGFFMELAQIETGDVAYARTRYSGSNTDAPTTGGEADAMLAEWTDGNNIDIEVGANSASTTLTDDPFNTNIDTILIGVNRLASSRTYWTGKFRYLAIFSGLLTAGEKTNMLAYVKAKRA